MASKKQSVQEKMFELLTIELLQHKYRYYKLDNPIISDYEYDMMEIKRNKIGTELGHDMDMYPNWIGFDERHPLATKAMRIFK